MNDAPRTVLVVDDERLLGEAIATWLRAHGRQVVMVTSAEDALSAMEAGGRFWAVLCDVDLPGMSGVELHARVRASWAELGERFVFMTGGVVGAQLRAALDALPNRRLRKPFEMCEIDAALDQLALLAADTSPQVDLRAASSR